MKKILSRLREAQDGVMALEACISLTLFLIVMLTLYSMLQMFTAQNLIAHAAQEACQSLAIENYSNSSMLTGNMTQIPNWLLTMVTGGGSNSFSESSDFSLSNFFTSFLGQGTTEKKLQLTTVTQSSAKKRFAAYLAGDETKADELLKNYGVVNGLNGISFSGTEKSGTDMTIQVTYKIRLLFYLEALNFGEFESTQKVCCRLWK
mgnify:CR=1 FL=1